MKIGFLLQRRFAYVGHAMALTFQKKYGVTKFCGYVYLRSSYDFLKSQKDINYTGLLLDDEIHKQYKNETIDQAYLDELERVYGIPNLWPYITLDRVVRYGMFLREYPHNTPPYSHEEMIKILQVKAKNITKFLEEEKPEVIIFSAIAGIGSLLLYHIAKQKGIQTFVIKDTRIGTKRSITEDYHSMTYLENCFEKIDKNITEDWKEKKMARDFLNSFRENPKPYYHTESPSARPTTRRKQFRFLLPTKIINSLLWIIKLFFLYFTNNNRDDHETIKPWHHLLDRLKRKLRVLVGFNDLYDEINESEDFGFYPLHMEPEIATMLYAPFFTDQLWLIKQIARSLPLKYKLYVKEHPAMFGFRPRSFYKELKKIPNVRLIRPTVSSFDIIKKAKIITTITGTAGWEGILLKKPVVTFGDVLYNKLPMVAKCRAIEDLPHIIKNQLENLTYDEDKLINFIAAIYKEGVDVDLCKLWTLEGGGNMGKKEQELVPLVDYIATKLELKQLI